MTPAPVIRVQVVRAWPRRHEMVTLALPDTATVADAVVASGFMPEGLALDAAGGCAIFGEHVSQGDRLNDGDRVELLRPLQMDPKDARRLRARKSG